MRHQNEDHSQAQKPEETHKRSLHSLRDHWPAWLVVILAAVAYVTGAARHVLGHDNGEYLVVGAQGGAPHPPGYPLYVLWLRLGSMLPVDNPAFASSLATVILGLATLGVLYQAARSWYCSRLASASAMAIYALSPRTWLLCSHAENLALNSLIASLILWVASPRSPLTSRRRPAAIGLLFGLGLANHHSIVLLAPLGLWTLLRGEKRLRPIAQRFAKAAGATVIGLSPYLYPVIVSANPGGRWVWGNLNRFFAVWAYFRRAEYGSFSLIAQRDGSTTTAVEQLSHYATRFSEDLLWLPALVVVLVVVADLAQLRLDPTRRRVHPVALAATFLLAGPVFASQLGLKPRGIALYQLARMYALSEVIAVVLVARGLHQLFRNVSTLKRVLQPLPAAIVIVGGIFAAPSVHEHHRPTIEWYLDNTLQSLPKNAILMGKGDLRLFGMLYLQQVRGRRVDVTFIKPSMLFRSWYRLRIEKQLQRKLDMVGPQGIDMAALADRLMATGRPLFIMDTDANHEPILQRFGNYPHGTAVRVLPAGTKPPNLAAIDKLNTQLLSSFRLEEQPKLRAGSFRAFAYRDYLRPWYFLESEYTQAKSPREAARTRQLRCRISKQCR